MDNRLDICVCALPISSPVPFELATDLLSNKNSRVSVLAENCAVWLRVKELGCFTRVHVENLAGLQAKFVYDIVVESLPSEPQKRFRWVSAGALCNKVRCRTSKAIRIGA